MPPTRERDFRLDFCRGVALIVIFIDHVPGNPLSSWTLRNFSFCDAAEVFVLISGMASYLAYGSRLSKQGIGACLRAIGRNCARIYLAHLLLIGGIAGLMIWVAHRYTGADYIDSLKLQWIANNPWSAIVGAMTLRYLPRLMDILPMYVLLLATAPGLILIIRRDFRVALLISLIVYLMAWKFGWNLSADRSGRDWYFNPFTWQLLYTIGMVVCHLSRTEPEKLPWGRPWLWGAVSFLAVTMVIAWPLNQLGLTQLAPFSYIWPADKTYLSPLRIINVLALLYVFAYYVSSKAFWLKKSVAEIFIACGRHSLTIYGLGLLFSCIGYVVIQECAAKAIANLGVNVIGIALLVMTALVLDRLEVSRKAVAPATLRLRREGSAAA
jgi:hypothetical protein